MGHPSTGACFMWGKERKADLGLSEVASFVRLGMGPASDREAVLLGFQVSSSPPPPPSSVAKTYQQFRDRQRLYPLLMRLRPEFEPLREQLLHRDPVPRLDTALSELIAEETRLRTLATHRASPEGGTHRNNSPR